MLLKAKLVQSRYNILLMILKGDMIPLYKYSRRGIIMEAEKLFQLKDYTGKRANGENWPCMGLG